MRQFSVERADPDVVRDAWSASNNALVFTDPDFLSGLCARVDWWVGIFRSNPIFYWPVCIDPAGNVVLPALPKYVGPFATDDFMSKAYYRQWSIQGDLFPAFLTAFFETYGQIAFTTRPGETDIRQMAWWSEQNESSLRLDIQPRYTAIIRDLRELSEADLLAKFRRDRKAQLSKVRELGLETNSHVAEQEIADLYHEFMQLKGQGKLAIERADQIQHIARYAKERNGEIIAFRDKADHLAGVLVLLYSRQLAHSALAIASEVYRNQGILALLEFEAMTSGKAAGKSGFDFLGANSEKGASEKHSYGATPQVYFKVESKK
ncbi:MAG: GNAT family N-acetyltransferase [Wenzhouxiangella sp.]